MSHTIYIPVHGNGWSVVTVPADGLRHITGNIYEHRGLLYRSDAFYTSDAAAWRFINKQPRQVGDVFRMEV